MFYESELLFLRKQFEMIYFFFFYTILNFGLLLWPYNSPKGHGLDKVELIPYQ